MATSTRRFGLGLVAWAHVGCADPRVEQSEFCPVMLEPIDDVEIVAGNSLDVSLRVEPEDAALRFTVAGLPSAADLFTARADVSGMVLTLTPTNDHVGIWEFVFIASDGECDSEPAEFTVAIDAM